MGKGSAASASIVPRNDSPRSYTSSPDRSTVRSKTTGRSQDASVNNVLHAIAKADEDNTHEIPFDDVPPELLCPDRLDLRTWSLLVSNTTCSTIERIVNAREKIFVDEALEKLRQEQVAGDEPRKQAKKASDQQRGVSEAMAATTDARWLARQEAYQLQRQKVEQDARNGALERSHTEVGLKEVRLGGCAKLGDIGLRRIAKCAPRLEVLDIAGAIDIHDVGLREVALHCVHLRFLDLGSCRSLTGPGIAAIGERCAHLKHVNLRGCSQAVHGWALAALSKGIGPSVEYLDLSHCSLLSDHDLMTVAKDCKHLTYLDVAHCRQIGDQGVVEVSNHCQRLETLKLARSALPHKLTDVAILSVAEGCGRTLKVLDLNGCELVTDVGVSWVAHQAGATLKTILLRNCDRLSNAGCRALADHCHVLEKVDIRGARRITDVGIRVLGAALGEQLLHLDVGQMHLLTDGMDRGFGFEGILALAQDAKCLRVLRLDGCFQVSKRSLAALAKGCSYLEELGLAGCPRLHAQEFGDLCHASSDTLEKVSLACCGDCVSDDLVVALARGAPKLKQLNLRDCGRFGKRGCKALAQNCLRLTRLDLTGCAGLTDEAVNEFSVVRWRPPGLQHLLLAHCRGVGDIGLAWLVEGPGSNDLVTLNITKCSCTTSALKSSRDYFPSSEMRRDTNFFGFWPKPRWEHRLLVQAFARDRKGVVKVQAGYRGLMGRRYTQGLRAWRALGRATLVLQKHWRGYLGRERYRYYRAKFVRETRGSTMICSVGRGYFARTKARRLRKVEAWRRATMCAIQVQAAYRSLVARRYATLRLQEAQILREKRLEGCVVIQRIYRGRIGRKRFKEREDEVYQIELVRIRACRKLQGWRRCLLAKWRVLLLREHWARRQELERQMAVHVQAKVRTFCTRRVYRIMRRTFDARLRVALFCQCVYRIRKAQILVYVASAEMRHQREITMASRIAHCYRCRAARDELCRRRIAYAEYCAHRVEATTIIQAHSRTWAAAVVFEQLKQDKYEFDERLREVKEWASTAIQSLYRGHCGRIRAVAVRDEKRARWKEMFDEDSRRPFFYNQITGEIRWRRPQDLLELMPRPRCGNCEYFEASLECSACQEFFCAECHGTVHFGGKRKEHPFRALYDAFGKRVDYGDGDFDLGSMWPSEIIQDDIAGILLRIAPHRDPASTIGLWQRYDDEDAQKSYFYNPVSGEGTYEKPQAVREHEQLSALQRAQQQSQEHGLEYDYDYRPGESYRPMTGVSFAGLSPTRPTTGVSFAQMSPERPQTGLSRKSIESGRPSTGGSVLSRMEGVEYSPMNTPMSTPNYSRAGTPASRAGTPGTPGAGIRGWTPDGGAGAAGDSGWAQDGDDGWAPDGDDGEPLSALQRAQQQSREHSDSGWAPDGDDFRPASTEGWGDD